MGDPLDRGERRVLLWPVVALVALAISAAVGGCAGGARPTPPAVSAGDAASTLVKVIRHGEKPDGSHPGVDA
jgi:hypothetical protein